MNKYFKDYGYLLSIATFLVGLDQLTKEIMRRNLAFQEAWSPWEWLAPYARIVHWRNTGAAFGMFQNGNLVFTILAFIVSGLILYYFPRLPREEKLLRFALSLQLGGAVGNLIDRLTQGYVTDFVSVGSFPVFNVADSCISIGAVLLVFSVWLKERHHSGEENQAEAVHSVQPDTRQSPLLRDSQDE